MCIVLYDNECPFCCNIVKKLSHLITQKDISYQYLKSEEGSGLIQKYHLENVKSIIYIDQHNKVFIKSNAVLNLCKEMKFPYRLFYVFAVLPKSFLDLIYDFIAKHRMKI
tara:strand:+ start:253 stop:582 length:330 start_codon:yes stop_codon:yes gene_type:complete